MNKTRSDGAEMNLLLLEDLDVLWFENVIRRHGSGNFVAPPLETWLSHQLRHLCDLPR